MKYILVCLALIVLLASAAGADESYGGKRNYVSFALGGYAPSGDLNDEGYKSGGDFTVSYMSPIKKYFGFGGGTMAFELGFTF